MGILQSFWVFLLLVPVILVNSASYDLNPPVNPTPWDVIGIALMLFGFVLQVTADLTKSSFRSNPDNRNFFCTVGVWQFSRHPNFFGEIVFWWGVWFSSVPVLLELGWWSLLSLCSPLWIMTLLIFVSGLPFAEGKYLAKFYENGQGESWEEYREATPPLCLIPCGLYAYVPAALKLLCCCEFPCLEYTKADAKAKEAAGQLEGGSSESNE